MHRHLTLITLFLIYFCSAPVIFSDDGDQNDLKQTELTLQLKDLQSKAMFHYYRKNYTGADAVIRQVQNLAPDSIEYNYLAGLSSYTKKDYSKSVESLEKAIAANPSHELSLYLLGMDYAALNDWGKALLYFEKAATVTYNPYYQLNLATAYLFNDNTPQAIAAARRAIELKANYSEAKIMLSRLLFLSNQKEEAWSYCQELKTETATDMSLADHCATLAFTFKKDWQEVINILGSRRNLDQERLRLLARARFYMKDYKNADPLYKAFVYTSSSNREEGMEYLEIILMNGNGLELEKFRNWFLGKFPDMNEKVNLVTGFAETKKDALNRFYYQFKQLK